MNLPPKLTLNRHVWHVEIIEDAADMMFGGVLCYGQTCIDTKTIMVYGKQSELNLIATFIHEYCHAVEVELGIKIPHWVLYRIDRPLARLFGLLMQYNERRCKCQKSNAS